MYRFAVLAVLVALPLLGVEAADTTPAPRGVTLSVLGDEAILTWLPPTTMPGDELQYKVYDLSSGAALLETVSGDHPYFFAEPGSEAFGVSAVVNGVESGISEVCITVQDDRLPPIVGLDTACASGGSSSGKHPFSLMVPRWLP